MEEHAKFRQRTDWAEWLFAQLAAEPLISENVYPNPQFLDKGNQKEVVDAFVTHAGRAILCSLKCQQDPGSRSADKERAWASKAAASAVSQINGALGTFQSRGFWCQHPRRGRVQFAADELRPVHGVVLVETASAVILSSEVPLHQDGVPISYLTVN